MQIEDKAYGSKSDPTGCSPGCASVDRKGTLYMFCTLVTSMGFGLSWIWVQILPLISVQS